MKHLPSNKPCVLIVNLGTPDAPTEKDVRRYLREFLSDRRVIETPPLVWKPILEGAILRVRPKQSAQKYASIWGDDGSPLRHYTIAQVKHVAAELGDHADIRYAMRYGTESIARELDSIYRDGYRELLVVPLYPQYSASTVATVADEVHRWSLRSRDQFDLRLLRSFPENSGYVKAIASAVRSYWDVHGQPNFAGGDKLILSYHGIPLAMHQAGDPYPIECHATTLAVTAGLGIAEEYVIHAYQSVFGPAQWLKPATIDTVQRLGKDGTNRVDVACPGFVSDCLETLEEINILNRETFHEAGGNQFHYIPWGNDKLPWLGALTTLVRANLAGWIKS